MFDYILLYCKVWVYQTKSVTYVGLRVGYNIYSFKQYFSTDDWIIEAAKIILQWANRLSCQLTENNSQDVFAYPEFFKNDVQQENNMACIRKKTIKGSRGWCEVKG